MQYNCNYFKVQLDSINTEPHTTSYWDEVMAEATFIIDCYGVYYTFHIETIKDLDWEIQTDWFLNLNKHFIKDFRMDGDAFEDLTSFVNKATWYLNANDWFTLAIACMLKGRH